MSRVSDESIVTHTTRSKNEIISLYWVAKTHKMPHLYMSFFAKDPCEWASVSGLLRKGACNCRHAMHGLGMCGKYEG